MGGRYVKGDSTAVLSPGGSWTKAVVDLFSCAVSCGEIAAVKGQIQLAVLNKGFSPDFPLAWRSWTSGDGRMVSLTLALPGF